MAEIDFYEDLGLDRSAANELRNARISGDVETKFTCRHSGDLYTGSGNCMVVASNLLSIIPEGDDIVCDGDDTLLFYDDEATWGKVVAELMRRGYNVRQEFSSELPWLNKAQ